MRSIDSLGIYNRKPPPCHSRAAMKVPQRKMGKAQALKMGVPEGYSDHVKGGSYR